ncbi:MAG TPA: hypothetical protein VI731_04665, partial [Bacteroidia bacterium]|nr:hypothetical protein [Bacteroidia bacterium]
MRIGILFRVLLLFFSAYTLPVSACAQVNEDEETIEERRSRADDLFQKEDYTAAMPIYSGLLANSRNSSDLNYHYGVCVLYASSDKSIALPFLQKASRDPNVDPEVWFFLGRAYHLNYQFMSAMKSYQQYKSKAGDKQITKRQIDNQIAMCKTGNKLLRTITD